MGEVIIRIGVACEVYKMFDGMLVMWCGSKSKQAASGLILNTYSCYFKKGSNGYCEVNNEGGIVDSCWASTKLFILLV